MREHEPDPLPELVVANPDAQQEPTPTPGTIDYARGVLEVRRGKNKLAERTRARDRAKFGEEELLEHKVPRMFWPDSAFWGSISFLGTLAMQALAHSARFSFGQLPRDSRVNSQVAKLFLFKNMAGMSDKVLNQFLQVAKGSLSETKCARSSLQGASALLEAGGLLWCGLLRSYQSLIECGRLEPILFIKKSRYDETPLKIRLQGQGPGSTRINTETSTHAKVMQSEFALHMVLKDVQNSQYWHLHGYVPTWLQLMDATTAENTKRVVLNNYQQIPGLDDFSRSFSWKLQQATVDCYAANQRAERSLLHDDPSWSKYTKSCDVHIVTQVHMKAASVLDSDISGMLHTSLAQHGAGVLDSLKKILAEIFENELVVVYDAPPQGRVRQHREELHDLFLPLPHANSLDYVSCSILVRRYILGAMMNGDLESNRIYHWCPFNCCKDFSDTVEKFKTYVVHALLPSKMPRFAKNRWNHQDGAVCWAGLLASHHGLLERLLTKFAGVPGVGVGQFPAEPIHQQAAEGRHAKWSGWDFLTDDDPDDGAAGHDEPPQPIADAAVMEGAAAENEGNVEMEDVSGETDWVKRNKAFKKNSSRWSQTNPGPRLVVMKSVMNVLSHAVNQAFQVSGSDFDREQDLKSAKGEARSYRMLEAARGEDLEKFYSELWQQFEGPCRGMPFSAMTSNLLNIHFVMLSRAGCAMEMLLRRPRRGQPYQLFKVLLQGAPSYSQSLSCLDDELSSAFHHRFPQWSPEAEVCLRALGQSIDVDVAQIETRHAIARRMVTLKGLQTWVPSIDSLSADWSHKQVSNREEEIYGKQVQQNACEILGLRTGTEPCQRDEFRLDFLFLVAVC